MNCTTLVSLNAALSFVFFYDNPYLVFNLYSFLSRGFENFKLLRGAVSGCIFIALVQPLCLHSICGCICMCIVFELILRSGETGIGKHAFIFSQRQQLYYYYVMFGRKKGAPPPTTETMKFNSSVSHCMHASAVSYGGLESSRKVRPVLRFRTELDYIILHPRGRQSRGVHGGDHLGKRIPRSDEGYKVEKGNKEEHIQPKPRIGREFRKALGRTIRIDRIQKWIGNHGVRKHIVGFVVVVTVIIIVEILVVVFVVHLVEKSLVLEHVRRVHDAIAVTVATIRFVSIVFVSVPTTAFSTSDSCEFAFSFVVVDIGTLGTQSALKGRRRRCWRRRHHR